MPVGRWSVGLTLRPLRTTTVVGKAFSHITLMLTQPDEYRDRMVGFFEQSIGQPDAVV